MSGPGRDSRRSGPVPGTFTVGRIRGVPVGVHWSAAIVVAVFAWGLATTVLPAKESGLPEWAYAAAGAVAAVVFLAGLLAHEVSHAVVARRNGVPVESITLWVFGGVAQLGGEADNPGAELRIAGVGPLVSLLLGLAVLGLDRVLAAAGASDLVVATLGWLAGVNVLLAVFNVLPGAPLDGGRLLRAALWKWRGDRRWAAIAAARAGRALGGALLAIGLALFLAYGGFNGVWLAMIGWFILGAASAEERAARVTGGLAGLRVRDVMTPSPATVPPDVSVALFIDRYLFAHRHSTFPVVTDERPVGLLTLSRVKQVPEQQRPWIFVGQVACPLPDVPVAGPEEPVTDLLPRLTRTTDGRALVVADDRLVGIVSPVDLNRAIEQSLLRPPPAAGPAGG